MTQAVARYNELRGVDVTKFTEQKNGSSYLSWAWAVDQLLQRDPEATWSFQWFDGKPYLQVFDTWMVFCTVRAFGVDRTVQLPILDYKNKPIVAPNAMDLNTSMMRCLAKAISLHGIGINIYAGEDLPLSVGDASTGFISDMSEAKTLVELDDIASHIREFVAQYPKYRDVLTRSYEQNKGRLGGLKVVANGKAEKGVAALKTALNKQE
jgi:hypothetical protein